MIKKVKSMSSVKIGLNIGLISVRALATSATSSGMRVARCVRCITLSSSLFRSSRGIRDEIICDNTDIKSPVIDLFTSRWDDRVDGGEGERDRGETGTGRREIAQLARSLRVNVFSIRDKLFVSYE